VLNFNMTEVKNPEFSKWETILAKGGLAPIKGTVQGELKKEGWKAGSFEGMADTEHIIKEGLDRAIVTENIFSSEIPQNKSGLAPCQRAKLETERSVRDKDPRLLED
jgi:hypothetical protein